MSKDTEISEAFNGFSPKNYQVEMYDIAKNKNIIVKLNTGSGKTFIAVMLIKFYLHRTNKSIEDGGKRIFFLVKNVNLVFQQAKVIRQHLACEDDPNDATVGEYHGQIKPGEWVDVWDKSTWLKVFNKHRIIVITAGVFKDILNHAKFNLKDSALVIFDECHHTAKEDDYSQICKHLDPYRGNLSRGPRILGLTACVVNGNIKCPDIEHTVESLELKMNARLVTSRSSVSRVNNSDTQEIIYPYNSVEFCPLFQEMLNQLENAKTQLVNYFPNKKRSERSLTPSSSAMTLLELEENISDKMKRSLSDAKTVLEELGPWCCEKVVQNYLRDLSKCKERIFEESSKKALNFTVEALSSVQSLYLTANPQMPKISRKCKSLLEILQQYDSKFTAHSQPLPSNGVGDESKKDFMGLVFVTERQVAYSLCELLTFFSKHCADFRFLNVDFITGQGTSSQQTREVQMSISKQNKTLTEFRKGNTNLMIATRVVEEGMDVQKCNLVIKMDLPVEFRSYVQSRGRARAANSFYIILTPQDKVSNCQYSMDNYQKIDKELNRIISNRCVDEDSSETLFSSSSSYDDCESYMPYGDKGPRITLNSSMNVLNKYLGRLRSDSILPLRIRLTEQYPDSAHRDPFSKLRYLISLPMPCPIREVVGDFARNKDEARKRGALKTCIQLHRIGELAEDLLPTKIIPLAMDEDLDDDWDMFDCKTGTKKRQRFYEIPVAEALSSKIQHHTMSHLDPGHVFHLYRIVCDPPYEELMNLVEPQFTHLNKSIAFLFPNPLPEDIWCPDERVAKFPLYMEGGCTMVSIHKVTSIQFHWDEPEQLKACHRTLVQLFLHSHHHYKEDLLFNLNKAVMPWTIVIIKESADGDVSIDWEITLELACHNLCVSENDPLPKFPHINLTEESENKWQGMITYTHHDPKEKGYFLIDRVTSFTPDSKLPHSELTFRQHYKNRYNKQINNSQKNILSCIRLPTPRDLLCYSKARDKNTSGKIRRMQQAKTLFIPEYCSWLPLPASLWIKLTVLPFVIYRLNQLMIGEQLFRTIHVAIDLPDLCLDYPLYLNPDECSIDVVNTMAQLNLLLNDSQNVSNSRPSHHAVYHFPKPQSPPPRRKIVTLTNLLTAVTLIQSKDLMNLEQLEIIGDSYLKFIVSVYLHAFCKPQDTEGHLTNRRRTVISNKNLYRIARLRHLQEYIHARYFLPRESFIPPGCHVKQSATPESAETTDGYCHVPIGDKWLADSVESLIGCFLWYSGRELTLRLLNWLDVKLIPDESQRRIDLPPTDFNIFKLPPPPNPLIDHNLSPLEIDERLDRLSYELEHLESKILNYKFKDRTLLLQAVTHPSWIDNRMTHCYQRLEFLGDAVLDYLVTMQICVENPDWTPGKITDLRSALVNNYLFAVVTVKFGIHKFLRHSDPVMFNVIHNFAEKIKAEDYNYYFDEVSYSKENNEAKVTIKVLGDLIESLAGAVYVDSGYDLQITREKFFHLLEGPLKQFKNNVPINLMRQFHEKFPGVKFIESEQLTNSSLFRLQAKFRGEIIGCETATSKQICRLLIAKKCLNEAELLV